MSIPTVAVTCTAYDQNGNAVAGGTFRARLNSTEIYNGFVVPEQVTGVADASGVCVLQLWPNALGVAGSAYRITAINPDTGQKYLDTTAVVPNSACNLHQIIVAAPYPTVDASEQALIAAQGALAAVTAQAGIATTKAAEASASATTATTQAGIATTQAGTATTQAGIATTQATTATTQADIAATQAGIATTQAGNATTQANTAIIQTGIAITKASEAAASAATATTQAGTATTQAGVATTKASEAAASATNADNSAYTAGLSVDAAVTAKNQAVSSASAAASSATAASGSATAASTSASSASASASTATTQAGTATTQAGLATTAATTATSKASEASTYASNASASANTATTQAGVATTQAGIATTQAGVATTQAGIAIANANAALSVYGSVTAQQAAVTAAQNAATSATASAATATTQATAAGTARTGAETARDAAVVAQNNAVAVVTGGTATLTPSATKIPLSDAQGKIAKGWLTNTDLVEQTDIGTGPNEIPLNQFLGELAYLDTQNIPTLGINVANAATANVTNLMQVTEISNAVPSLNLDFAKVKQLDPRITFTRASTGTYYDGKTVAKAEENLLRWSQDFDNAVWTKGNATVTANTSVAPDGTTTAAKLVENTATAEHRVLVSLTLSTATFTASTYFKAAERSFAFIRLDDSVSSKYVYFNLATGTVGDVTSGLTAFIENIGNGWYRCAARFNTPAAGSGSVVFASTTANGTNSYTGDGTSGIFIWGAQLEQRASATAYTPTTTQPVTNYIPVLQTAPAGVPRFEHNPVTGESLGLEIEEQRTNLLLRSQEFDSADWTKQDLTVIANTVVAPDGTLTADAAIPTAASSAIHRLREDVSTSAVAHTITVYAKSAGYTKFGIVEGAVTGAFASFDLSGNGSVISTGSGGTGTVVAVGNGWYRCSLTFTASTTARAEFRPLPDSYTTGSPNITFTGNGFSGIYIWGAQLEAGAFPTSYIPTVASQVTRAADSAVMTGANFSSWYNQTEGTFMSHATTSGDVVSSYNLTALNAASSSIVGFDIDAAGVYRLRVTDASVNQALVQAVTLTTANTTYKIAGAYKENSFAATANGGAVATDAVGTVPTGMVSFAIGSGSLAGAISWNGTIKKITYYPQRLSNAELVEMTA